MMRLLPLLMLMLPLGHAWGQVYFDRLYDADGLTETLNNALRDGDGYLFAMRSRNVLVDTGMISLVRTDASGNESVQYVYDPALSTFTFGKLTPFPTGGHVLFNSIATTGAGNGRDIHMMRYAADGALIWAMRFGEQWQDEISYCGAMLPDGRMVGFGQSNDSAVTTADLMLIQVNPDGTELWRRYYGGTGYEGPGYDGVIPTPDSGYLLLGWTRSYGAGQRDWYLVKTDSLGNQQWQRTYGGNGDEGGSCIIALSDGNYLLTGGGWNETATGSIGRLYKIDPLGEVIWSQIYELDPDNYLFKTIELEDGSLVSTGLTSATDDAGWLLKTDSEGNEIWQRKYNKNNSIDLFYSVLATVDGGFLLSGQAINLETNNQDAWLLKVDSIGCPYPNCLVGVDEVEKSKVVVDVWPNPASEVLNVEFQERGKAEILLVDMTGRVMCQGGDCFGETLAMTGRGAMDVSTFENGLYLLTIIQGEMRTTLKVVVQH